MRHRRLAPDGTSTPCICPALSDHIDRPAAERAPAPQRSAVLTARIERVTARQRDPNVYQRAPRPNIRTRPCPKCRVTCELVITVNEKEQLLDILPSGEVHEEGLIVIEDTLAGPRARQYGKGKVPDGAVRRVPHIAKCVKEQPDRWVRPAPRPRH